MSVKRVEFVEEVDNRPENNRGWDSLLEQGETVTNYNIYRLVNSDGTEQFVKLEIIINSYGDAEGVGKLSLTEQTEKTVTVWV